MFQNQVQIDEVMGGATDWGGGEHLKRIARRFPLGSKFVYVTETEAELYQFTEDYIDVVAEHRWGIDTVRLKPNGQLLLNKKDLRVKGGTWLLEDTGAEEMVGDNSDDDDGKKMAKMILAYRMDLHKMEDAARRFQLYNSIDAEEGWEDALEPSGKNAKVTEKLMYPYGQRIAVRYGLNEAGADGKMSQDFKATVLNNNWVRWDETEGDEDKEVQLNGDENSWKLCMNCDSFHSGACRKKKKGASKKRKKRGRGR